MTFITSSSNSCSISLTFFYPRPARLPNILKRAHKNDEKIKQKNSTLSAKYFVELDFVWEEKKRRKSWKIWRNYFHVKNTTWFFALELWNDNSPTPILAPKASLLARTIPSISVFVGDKKSKTRKKILWKNVQFM